MKYKITFGNQISALNGFVIFTILVIAAIWLVGINEGFELDLFVFFIIFYLVNLIAVLFVHYQYYKKNRSLELLIEQDKKQLVYKANNYVKTLSFNEIQKVEIYMMPSMYRGSNIQILPFESYHYAVIHTLDKEKLIVTCLVVKNLIKVFTDLNINITRKKCIYPNIK